jgi:rSAM/selenodomain-associated transferase 1
VPGKVKTRLAKSLGKEKALEIYKMLLKHTHHLTHQLPVDRFVFYEDFVNENDLWNISSSKKILQIGDGLGDRMQHAFKTVFEMGYSKAAIIGSDCLELTSNIILRAFDALDNYHCVIGPANDGGYYLLGMTYLIPTIFSKKDWSTSSVLKETISDLDRQQIKFYPLEMLRDIDVEADIDWNKINAIGIAN